MPAFLTVMACDALFIVLAIPLMLRKVRPNVLYGYRTRATLTTRRCGTTRTRTSAADF
jgi:hypothetical protein